jgi:hypothetical protein
MHIYTSSGNFMKAGPVKILIIIIPFALFQFYCCAEGSATRIDQFSLEQKFISPPKEARPDVIWWWLNSFIDEEGINNDLEEMKKQGIGGALIFDAAPVDRWKPKNVDPAPVGPPFMSNQWRKLFRHAIKEADRLDIELGVSLTSGFNAGGPWVTPEFGQQEIVWSEVIIDQKTASPILLPLPSGPVYDEQGGLLSYNEMQVNNDLERDKDGLPVHYQDIAVIAFPQTNPVPRSAGSKPDPRTMAGRLKNWALKSVHSFNYPEEKGFRFKAVYDNRGDFQGEAKIKTESIINLTHLLDAKGNLSWKVPSGGKWHILRFGHTYTGIRLQATNPQNEGLAMNHLSAEAAGRHFEEIGKKMLEDISAVNGQNLVYFYLDSWEVRIANWTSGFSEDFRRRRGYKITPYLPVLAGFIVENREISNRFLHDYRMTIGDCIADNYYGKFRDLSHQNGLQFRAEMATTPIPVDMLKCLGRVDIPFGEFWTETDLPQGRIEPWERQFGKQAAAAAHIYGKRFAAAEALTVIQKHWEHSPYQLKKTIDQAFCSGLNRLMIHTFTHSPAGTKAPGYEYFAGTHFNPQITWWNQAHAFTSYISRCQYLLQQGHFVADVCFYQGDQIPAFVPMKQSQPGLGAGYDYDVVNTEVILNRMSVEDGWITLPDGMHYRLLILPDSKMINPAVLDKIINLVKQGATVIGPRPDKAYGLENYPREDSLIMEKAGKLWEDCDGINLLERPFGKGRIVCGKTARQILINDGILPDFEFECMRDNPEIDYIHRYLSADQEKIDIYFVCNSSERWEEVTCTFRIDDRVPEIWHPDSGEMTEQVVYRKESGRIRMPIRLAPFGSVFVVFRKPADSINIERIVRNSQILFPAKTYFERTIPAIEIVAVGKNQLLIESWQRGDYQLSFNDRRSFLHTPDPVHSTVHIKGPWVILFPRGWGAPDSIQINELVSWTKFKNRGIKYFSGTAVYQTDFSIEKDILRKDTKCYIDLGVVKELAELTINEQALPTLWKPPFLADITPWIRSGKNHLEIKVTNLWPNRLIGDQWLEKKDRFTFTNIGKFTKDTPLLESGLLGPVKIFRAAQEILTY